MINYIIISLIMVLSIPVGFMIAYLCKEELKSGRNWFLSLGLASFIAGSWFFQRDVNYISLSFFFIVIISFVSYWKSFDKRWTKR